MFASNNSSLPSPSAASARNRPVMDENVEDCDRSRKDSVDDLIFSEVYLSLVWHRGQLGLAYYDLSSFQIHVMSDTLETDDFVLTKQVLREIQPRVIIMSSIQDGRLVSYIKKFSSDTSSICSQSSGSKFEPFKLEYLANSEFSYEVSKRRILAMKLPSIPDHLSEEERKMYFASVIPMGQINMVRAIGGLHKYLERNRVGVELEDSLTSVPILGFRTFALENYIQIDTMTYMALNIFDTEVHPSVYKFGGSSGKEGLSLFGILNRCKSSIGARMLRQWFLRPVKNAALLGQRHNAVSFFVTPRNMDVVSCLHGCLKHIKYLPKILWRMSKAQATVGDLEALYKTIYHAFYIGKISRAQPQSVDIFHKIAAAFTEDLQRCANLIHRTIDFEESKKLKKFVIKAHVDKNLDAKKRLFHGVPDILNQVAREELEGLSDEIDHCSASYLPQLGYLLVIDMPDGKTENDDHSIEGLQYKFASNRQLFYKSPRTCELDAQLGDIQLEISDMEVNILHGLQSAVLENSQVLLDVMEMSAELDCLMALATCANEFVYTCPKLVQEEVINIKGGRHPLQEMCCSPYVPNDTVIGGQNSRIQLLTGPNACGKSVYLKQVALIVFMSHIGSFVPAESASIGPVDQFFSRIKSMDSVSNGMSTFLQDSLQVARALNEATQSSLVIVDEFGKGTESIDGLALLTAVIKFWIDKGTTSPFVLISTHYHSIIQQKLLPPSPLVQFLTLDTLMNGAELVFLYQIKEGSASSSHACYIAAQVGLPQHIVKRGVMVSELLSQNKSVPCMKDATPPAQRKRHEEIVEAFMQLDLERDHLQTFLKDFVLAAKLPEHYQHHQNLQETSVQTKAKIDANAPLISATGNDGPCTSLQAQGMLSVSTVNPGGLMQDVVTCNEGKSQTSKVDAVPSLQAQVFDQHRKLNSSPSPEMWDKNNYKGLLQRKYAAAAQVLEAPDVGLSVEHFSKTPLALQPFKKQKFTLSTNCSSKDKASSSRSDFCLTHSESTGAYEGSYSCCSKSVEPCTSSS